jgi:hypothetical protein
MNKKGAFDLIVVIILLICAAITGIIATKILTEVTAQMKLTDLNQSVNSVTAMDAATNATQYLDYFVLILFIGSYIGLIISSMYVDVHPAFFVFFLILFVISIVLAGIIANAYLEMTAQPELASTAATFKFSNYIFNHLPTLILIMGATEIIILYSKTRSSGGI